MYVLSIIHNSIVDGEGMRNVLFLSGCPHMCKGCHNPSSWNRCNGKKMTITDIVERLVTKYCDITISGGEPFDQMLDLNILVYELKNYFPEKTIWLYTGYTIEELQGRNCARTNYILSNIDVLVDGKYIEELRDVSLDFRGSSNQRIINMKEIVF